MNDDIGDGSRRAHERMWVVNEQEQKLELCIRQIREVCTEYELIGILGRVLGNWLHGIAKCGIRRERHRDENTPGDPASPNPVLEERRSRSLQPDVGQEAER